MSQVRCSVRLILLAACLLFAMLATGSRGGSIFDDDWTPPPVAPHGGESIRIPEPTPNPENPQTPAPTPDAAPALDPSDTADARPGDRRKVPVHAEQAKSRALLKDVFGAQLADRSPGGRRKLVDALLGEAAKESQTPSDEFALLAGAIQGAEECGDLKRCYDAIDLMSAKFEVLALDLKADATKKIPAKVYKLNSQENTKLAEEVVDALVSVDRLADAQALSDALLRVTAEDAVSHGAVARRAKMIASRREETTRIQSELAKLKASPNDPDANGAVGSYLCFHAGRWDSGLPLLARGADAKLKALAVDELARPTEPEAIANLADRWWNVAPSEPETLRPAILRHAGDLYASMADKLSGLRKTLIQKRIDQVRALDDGSIPATLGHGKLVLRFTEGMGYKIDNLQVGALTHSNAEAKYAKIPSQFIGKQYTQLFVDRATGVSFVFVTSGKAIIFAGEWEGYAPQAQAMRKIAHEETKLLVRNDGGGPLHVWSIVGEAGQRVEIPFPAVLVADRLERVDHLP